MALAFVRVRAVQRLFFGIAAVLAFLSVAMPAAASTLSMASARREANLAAFEFGTRHHLDESNVGRCRRITAQRVSCAATAKGESTATTKACELKIAVKAIEHRFYTDVSTAITHHHCTTSPKERLTSTAAAAAIQAKADGFAGAKTEISSLTRLDELSYIASARWERPAAHPTEFDTTESCSVSLTAKLADGQIAVETEGFACF
jgi:ribosomal protein L31